MISAATLLVTLVAGGSGAVLATRRDSRASGLWLMIAALAVAGAVVAHLTDGPGRLPVVLALAGTFVAFPTAVLGYPRWGGRRPFDFVLTTTVLASGVLAVVFHREVPVVESMGMVLALAVTAHLWWRIETTTGHERTALQWLAVTLGICGLVVGLLMFATESFGGSGMGVVQVLLAAPIGPAMVVGVLRPDVLDVRGVVVWGVVTLVAVIVFMSLLAGVVAGVEAMGADPSPGTVGLVGAVLAIGFHPTVVLLRGVEDRLLFGDRPDPLRAATQVADHIGDDPVLALQAVREALVLPYASLRVEGRTLATSGEEVAHTRALPLRLGGDRVGEIVVGLRAGDLTLAAADADVLRIVAPLLAQTLRAQALARDLQASRNATIVAIEEERRRLRRDLHDGLGPTLSGVAFSADAARNQLRTDPDESDALLQRLRADTAAAIAEVRRLVEGLRPPALDELGLLGAVRQHAATLLADGGAPLAVTISAPESLPELPAAAEVTAYRVIVEALTNVARHASATRAEVELAVPDGRLRLAVRDDGRGSGGWRPGVGMTSMRERVEQVGGTLVAAPGRDGGVVEAEIPLGPSDQPSAK